MKIVLIGAGSESFGRGQIADILQSKDLPGHDVTLSLVDTNDAALTKMHRVAQRMAEHVGSNVTLQATTDRCDALPGADFVVTAVTVRRYELWEQDFRIPLSYGFKHVLGENGGPGAMFHALRNLQLVLPICHDVEKLAPKARLLNFTNPEARILHAIRTLTDVDAYGFCHGVFGAIDTLASYLDRPAEQLDIVSAGMNHFYAILKCVDRETGEDLLPQAIKRAAEETGGHLQLFRHFAEAFGLFVFPSDDHIGEYVSYAHEYCGTQWPYGLEKRQLAATDPVRPDVLAEYADGKRPADDPAVLAPSGESVTPIICDLVLGRENRHPAVNVLNDVGYIDNLPRDGVVEVPCRVDGDGIHAVAVGSIPRALETFLRPQFEIIRLVTEAYRTGDRKLLLQALLLDPIVDSAVRAEQMLDNMLRLQAAFLPTFE